MAPAHDPGLKEWKNRAQDLGGSPPASYFSSSITRCSSPSQSNSTSWVKEWASYLTFWRKNDIPSPSSPAVPPLQSSDTTLGTQRTVSSIPRTSNLGASRCPVKHLSPNAETADPETSESGKWVYPSELQFFSALQRKGHAVRTSEMSVMVPIHNAVNERAWHQILEWEAPYQSLCGGPKLHSFLGNSNKMTPKARIMTILGYQKPFDRHDWTVDRCGKRIDYVIDFYTGKGTQGKVSFYLDVRPKLNSLEGIKMRTLRCLGIV